MLARPGVLATVLLSSPILCQQPPSTTQLRTTTNLVQIAAAVRNRTGQLVRGLTASDFTIYDNGVRQSVALFHFFPFSRRRPGKAVPGELLNQQPDPTSGTRTILIVIPSLNFDSRNRVFRAMYQALSRGEFEGDSVAIVDNSGRTLAFTRDHEQMAQAVSEMQNKRISPCYESLWWVKTRELLLSMKPLPGRKFLVMFTDLRPSPLCRPLVPNTPSLLLDDALEANVPIYPVDARGLIPVLPFGDASMQGYGSLLGAPDQPGLLASESLAEVTTLAGDKMELSDAATRSGGRAVNDNDLGRVFRLVDEDSSYYELGYYLPDLQADGRYHRIKIEVKQPGTRVHARAGYYAPVPFGELSRARKRDWLYKALLIDRPLRDVQIATRTDYFPDLPTQTTYVPITCEMRWWVPKQDVKNNRRWLMTVGMVRDQRTGAVLERWQVTAALREQTGEIIAGPFQIGLSEDGTSSGVPILHRFDLHGLGIREGRYSVELKILHRHTYWHTSYAAPVMVLKDASD